MLGIARWEDSAIGFHGLLEAVVPGRRSQRKLPHPVDAARGSCCTRSMQSGESCRAQPTQPEEDTAFDRRNQRKMLHPASAA